VPLPAPPPFFVWFFVGVILVGEEGNLCAHNPAMPTPATHGNSAADFWATTTNEAAADPGIF
jgi:hypothetical protein